MKTLQRMGNHSGNGSLQCTGLDWWTGPVDWTKYHFLSNENSPVWLHLEFSFTDC